MKCFCILYDVVHKEYEYQHFHMPFVFFTYLFIGFMNGICILYECCVQIEVKTDQQIKQGHPNERLP